MSSASLVTWAAIRADRIRRLRAAHEAFGGSGPGRRWVTDELNHALILRLASEFQGFARDLHDESGLFVARCLAPRDQQLQDSLRIPYTLYRKMNQGMPTLAPSGMTSACSACPCGRTCKLGTLHTLEGGTRSWQPSPWPAMASSMTTARRSPGSRPTAGPDPTVGRSLEVVPGRSRARHGPRRGRAP
jgi:hypothetical protein